VCIDLAVVDVLRKLVLDRGLWLTTYAVDYQDVGYTLPTEEQFNPLRQKILDFIGDTEMGCDFSEIQAGLEAIAASLQSLANNSCCGQGAGQFGTGGSGSTQEPPSEVETGTPGEHTGDPPAGFDTWQDYDDYKCAVATWIIDQMIGDLQNASFLQFASGMTLETVATLIAAAIISPIPGDEVILVAGLILSAIALGIVSLLFDQLADALSEVRDDLVCDLFIGSSVSVAAVNAQETIDAACDANMDDVTAGFCKNIASAWLSNDNLNRLFVKDGSRSYPVGDCGDCDAHEDCQQCADWIVAPGAGTLLLDEWNEDGNREMTVQAEANGGYGPYAIAIKINPFPSSFPASAWNDVDTVYIEGYTQVDGQDSLIVNRLSGSQAPFGQADENNDFNDVVQVTQRSASAGYKVKYIIKTGTSPQ
jgi:hypothetical protein